MFNLIITIIAIALFALILVAGMSYVNPKSLISAGDSARINHAITSVAGFISQFNLLYDAMPETLDALVANTDLVKLPTLPANLIWASPGIHLEPDGTTWLCLGSDALSAQSLESLIRTEQVLDNFEEIRVFIDDACYSGQRKATGELLPTLPGAVWLSYKVL